MTLFTFFGCSQKMAIFVILCCLEWCLSKTLLPVYIIIIIIPLNPAYIKTEHVQKTVCSDDSILFSVTYIIITTTTTTTNKNNIFHVLGAIQGS